MDTLSGWKCGHPIIRVFAICLGLPLMVKPSSSILHTEQEILHRSSHSIMVGSKPLSHSCGQNSNVASAFRAVWAQPNSTSTLDLVPAMAALNESTHYECEIRSQCWSSPNNTAAEIEPGAWLDIRPSADWNPVCPRSTEGH